MNNPFTISFGTVPVQNISRDMVSEEITNDFTGEISSSHVYMITGVRGSGKTVLMTEIAGELKKEKDWYAIDLNPDRDMLQAMAGKLYAIREAQKLFEEAELNLSLFGFGVTFKHSPPITDMEAAISAMLSQLKKHGKRLLITVDEAVNNPYVRTFASSFQSFLREGYPVYLVMTGLYDNINNLQNEKNLTFLYRAPKISLRPLSLPAVMSAYRRVFDIDEETGAEMAKLTGGYPFAFQVLGYLCWKNDRSWDADEIMPRYDQFLEEYSYEKIWSELTGTDQRILTAMTKMKDATSVQLQSELSMSAQMFYNYKKRLLRKGVITEIMKGKLQFALPRFREFIVGQMMFGE